MAIFGRKSARQRLRRATRESLTIPAFRSPVDCTPWVIGGLWPAELSTITAETASLAEHLNTELRRIADGANGELRSISRAGLPASARRAAEAEVIDEARARAQRRVESTVRQLRSPTQEPPARSARPAVANRFAGTDLDKTQVMQAITVEPAATEATEVAAETESDDERLQRLLAFVVRQEPRLNWAVGTHPDGTTVLVTDLAHGWIPPGIALPDGVRLLEPERRAGRAAELLGNVTRSATYTPGDPMRWPADVETPRSSMRPRELPAVEDLGRELGAATHRRGELPRMVHTVAKAAASGTGVIEAGIDLLRVHLDTARHRLQLQYPDVEPALLLDCLLLAAIESLVTGDVIAANYHLAWFQKLERTTGRPSLRA
ncbi:DUF5632 domain-containing protein [Mycobacterium lacus]|uniref:DUF5632 domain-containing protein n=1 Tax=Mycobacterium lacus TaxID=169765 RepID=UPI000A168D1B|nr:DUF5631 domain-containing protein [Mycobacterium lacus]MCV7122137.1 DUF5632 domain-containing protein [Mycobacterium lacus]ORV99169.1 hypothetical protein AWC15_10620 [Mycobacterium lacus]